MQCVAVCCSVLQCVAVCCSVLQCVAVRLKIKVLMQQSHTDCGLCSERVSQHKKNAGMIKKRKQVYTKENKFWGLFCVIGL